MGAPRLARDSGTTQPGPRDNPVGVMLVDDSIVARSILESIISEDAGFAIVASVATAREALAELDTISPDIIVLDIEMPGMNGLAALPLILERSPASRVFILSANANDGGPAAIEALSLGAADTLVKPGRGSFAGGFGQTLLARLRALSSATIESRVIAQAPPAMPTVPSQWPDMRPISAIGIGASTGGIIAINAFLSGLNDDVDCPIFITQHLPDSFMTYFADQLRQIAGRDVRVAEQGLRVVRRTVYLAPGDGHIQLVRVGAQVRIEIVQHRVASGAMPSVDPMMASMARVYGQRACAVMLSGMGRDGLEGVRALRAAGALIAAQSIESSVVWGMPGAIVKEGMAQIVQSPAELAVTVSRVMMQGQADG